MSGQAVLLPKWIILTKGQSTMKCLFQAILILASSDKLKILLKRLLIYRNLYLCNSLDRHNVPMTGVERYDTSSATWNYSLTHLAPISCDQPAGQPIGLTGWPAARRTGWSVKDQKTPQKPTFAFEFYRCTLCLLAQWSIQKKLIRKT